MTRASVVLCIAAALAGCAAVPAPSARDDESRQVTELIELSNRVSALRVEDQRKELNSANQLLARERSGYARARLALLLALPGTGFQDDVRAVTLLEQVAGEGHAGALRQFAALLNGQISDRLRENRRAAQLKEQLDGLRAVDRTMIERGAERPR